MLPSYRKPKVAKTRLYALEKKYEDMNLLKHLKQMQAKEDLLEPAVVIENINYQPKERPKSAFNSSSNWSPNRRSTNQTKKNFFLGKVTAKTVSNPRPVRVHISRGSGRLKNLLVESKPQTSKMMLTGSPVTPNYKSRSSSGNPNIFSSVDSYYNSLQPKIGASIESKTEQRARNNEKTPEVDSSETTPKPFAIPEPNYDPDFTGWDIIDNQISKSHYY